MRSSRSSSIVVVVGTTVLGALLMAPIGTSVGDGGRDCRGCGSYAMTLIGLQVRERYWVLLVPLGAAAGLLVGMLIVMAWRLVSDRWRAKAS
jgi:hypothetical protein